MSLAPGPARWQVVTGEYPPQRGGVADYTRLVAEGLAARGEAVDVWAPPIRGGQGREGEGPSNGVTVRREAGRWSRADFARIGRGLDRIDSPRRLLVQFAPNAFGYRGLNFGLPRWLASRRRAGDSVRLMFHEVTYIVKPGDRPARRLLAFAQRRLVARMLRQADVVDVNVPAWGPMLWPLDHLTNRPYRWLPVPSNVPAVDDPAGVAEVRRRLTSGGASILIGHFGTFSPEVTRLLAGAALPLLLGRPDRAMVLIGRGGGPVADAWVAEHPGLAGRAAATGGIGPEDVSKALQACDLLIQPYPGGVATKRGSMMAGIANGVAAVTTVGEVTEPIWAAEGAAATAREGDHAAMVATAEALLADPAARDRLGAAGRSLYERRFALGRTLDALLDADKEAARP